MAEIVTPDRFTRRDFARLASLTIGGFASAPLVADSGHECATGLRRGIGSKMSAIATPKTSWAKAVIEKTYPTSEIIKEYHTAKYTEEITKEYGVN